ncbi:hypothetical protein ACWCRF_27695 [Streptomyces sp. NPDC002405]|uniref:hypothetical protein n=1 Tax=unclassified Streptomyces TaxID=2593676 RepID=UPI003683E8C9
MWGFKNYLHPTRDLYWVKSDCETGATPQITFWLKNHAAHSMAYGIRYDYLEKQGKVVGHAEGVFSAAPHQVIGDEALHSAGGVCRPKYKFAFINAYDNSGEGADQPHF